MKRFVAVLASAALTAGLLIGSAGAAQAAAKTYKYKGDTFTYYSVPGGVEITRVSSKDRKITFPKAIRGKAVVQISAELSKSISKADFSKATKLRTLELSAPYVGRELDLSRNTKLTSLALSSWSSRSTQVVLPKSKRLRSLWLTSNRAVGDKPAYTTDLSRAGGLTSISMRYQTVKTPDPKRSWKLTGLTKLKHLAGLALEGPTRKLNLTGNPKLTDLELRDTNLTSLDLTRNPRLTTLGLHTSRLKQLDLSRNGKLTDLDLTLSPLASLTLDGNPRLRSLRLAQLPLTRLDLRRTTKLEFLDLLELPKLAALDVSEQTALEVLALRGAPNLTTVDISKLTPLWSLLLTDLPKLTSVDLSKSHQLTHLYLDDLPNLASIELRHSRRLLHLELELLPKLAVVDLSENPDLTVLHLLGLPQFTSLDLSRNPALTVLTIHQVPLAVLDLRNNPLLDLDESHNHIDDGIRVIR